MISVKRRKKLLKRLVLKYYEHGMNNSYLSFFEDELEKDVNNFFSEK